MSSGKKKGEDQLRAATVMGGHERQQYEGGLKQQNTVEQINYANMGLGPYPQGYLSPEQQYFAQGGELGKTLWDQTLTETRDPYAYYKSTLTPQLQIAEDYINRAYQNRGLLTSGMNIEQMGRAGVELAVKEADSMMQNRASSLQRAAGLTEYVGNVEQQNLSNMQAQANQRIATAQPQLARQAEGNAYIGQAALGDYYGSKAALYSLPGQALGAAGNLASAYATGGLTTALQGIKNASDIGTQEAQSSYEYLDLVNAMNQKKGWTA